MLIECDGCHKMFRVRDGTPSPYKRCDSCGRPLRQVGGTDAAVPNHLRCPSCRHVNQENWNFCSACGAMREP